MQALTTASEQFSTKLDKMITGTSIRLLGHAAGLARFAEGLRQTRSVLDSDCQRIDTALKVIGFGDAEPETEDE